MSTLGIIKTEKKGFGIKTLIIAFVFVLSSGGGGGGFNSSGRSGTHFWGTKGRGREGGRDFFREGRVGDHCITMLLVGLVEEVELMDSQEEEEEEEITLGEAVEMVFVIAVGVGWLLQRWKQSGQRMLL